MTALTAIDTNILFHALDARSERSGPARAFLDARADDADTVLSELVLVEFYVLLRNPVVMRLPMAASDASDTIQRLRRHPRWRIVDHDPAVMDELWIRSSTLPARNRIFDARLALGLRRHGVTRFATRNVKDFQGFGFDEVFDPIEV